MRYPPPLCLALAAALVGLAAGTADLLFYQGLTDTEYIQATTVLNYTGQPTLTRKLINRGRPA